MAGNGNTYGILGGMNRPYDTKERTSSEAEEGQTRQLDPGYNSKKDPFGDESTSEVKYRTLKWR